MIQFYGGVTCGSLVGLFFKIIMPIVDVIGKTVTIAISLKVQ